MFRHICCSCPLRKFEVGLIHIVNLTMKTDRLSRDRQMGQTPHHRPAKTVFSTVPSNSDCQSCKEQLKIGLCRQLVWRMTFSGVGRMITCRSLDILCRVNTKGKWQIQRRMNILRCWESFPYIGQKLVTFWTNPVIFRKNPDIIRTNPVTFRTNLVKCRPSSVIYHSSFDAKPIPTAWLD